MDNNDATAPATSVAAADTGTASATINEYVALTDHNHNDIPQPNSKHASDNNPSYNAIAKAKFFKAKEVGKPSLFQPKYVP